MTSVFFYSHEEYFVPMSSGRRRKEEGRKEGRKVSRRRGIDVGFIGFSIFLFL